MEETYNEVWQVWQKEKQSAKLQQIPKTFYEDAFKYIEAAASSTETEKASKENLERLLNNIYERRKQKLLVYLAYSQAPPQPLPKDEEKLYNKLASVLGGEKLQRKQDQGRFIVLQDVPKMVLPSGKEMGPLEKGKTVEVADEYDRGFLLSNNICRQE